MSTSEDNFIHSGYIDELGTRINPCIEILAITDATLEDGPHKGLLNFYEAFLPSQRALFPMEGLLPEGVGDRAADVVRIPIEVTRNAQQ